MKEKLLYWIPRILTILAILFMIMFSLDVFGGNEPVGRQLLGFLMHNIPAFILTAILFVAWKWEVTGGVLFIVAAIAGSFFFRAFSGNPASLIVMIPFCIVGILFILHHSLLNKSE
ncbi:MAG: hypothetical protein IPN67_06265 [Bacteroidales bacterium]|nr:hypothetical protein [Bacteroidales bacterium]MBK8881993.1 hypothetical protein [Bacteroidales bacterium]